MPKNKSGLRILLLLLVFALVLAACDSEEEESNENNDASTPTPAVITASTEEAVVPAATDAIEAATEAVVPAATEAMAMVATEEAAGVPAATEAVEVAALPTEDAVVPAATEAMAMAATEEAAVMPAATEAVEIAAATEEAQLTILGLALANSDTLSTLVGAVQLAQMEAALDDPSAQLTVFAPVDAAFGALDPETVSAAMADQALLTSILNYHVVDGVYMAADLTDGMELTTLSGETLTVRVEGANVFINDAQVVTADLTASNGVVHLIDAVLLPPMAATPVPTEEAMMGMVSTEAAEIAMMATEAVEMVATAEAVVPAATEAVEMVATEAVEMSATAAVDMMATDAPAGEAEAGRTLVDVANANDIVLSAFLGAVEAAGLTETLSGEEEYTVFAPINSAFAALPKEAVDALMADPEALSEVLLLHVVEGRVMAADLTDGMELTTVSGETLTVSIITTSESSQEIYINNARVVFPDITADNGVLHMVNRVIEVGGMPNVAAPAAEATAEPTEAVEMEMAPTMEATEAAG